MKLKIVIFVLFSSLILSCKTNKYVNQDEIIEQTTFSKENYYKYNDRFQDSSDTNKIILYSNVRPLKENGKIPEKIYESFFKKIYSKSIKYFQNDLKGKSISYLEKKNKIVFRHFFQDYKGVVKNDTHFRSKTEVVNYLNKNKINYIIIKSYKKSGADILDLNINNQFARIVTTSDFCESYSCYDLKDSINIEYYRTITANFYR